MHTMYRKTLYVLSNPLQNNLGQIVFRICQENYKCTSLLEDDSSKYVVVSSILHFLTYFRRSSHQRNIIQLNHILKTRRQSFASDIFSILVQNVHLFYFDDNYLKLTEFLHNFRLRSFVGIIYFKTCLVIRYNVAIFSI